MRRSSSLPAGIVFALACGAPACAGDAKTEAGGALSPTSVAGASASGGAGRGAAAVGGGGAGANAGRGGSALLPIA